MKNFNWKRFKAGEIAVHCDTEEKAKDFVKKCYENNIKWYETKEFSKTHWYEFEENTFYFCSDSCNLHYLHYGDSGCVEDEIVIEWKVSSSSYPELKDGMVAETREGKLYLVRTNYDGEKILCNDKNWEPVSSYNEELKIKNMFITDLTKLDIMKVYIPLSVYHYGNLNAMFNKDNLTCIWEREEVIEMTLAQVCKELGKNIKIIKED